MGVTAPLTAIGAAVVASLLTLRLPRLLFARFLLKAARGLADVA
jgi:hypothetical protein